MKVFLLLFLCAICCFANVDDTRSSYTKDNSTEYTREAVQEAIRRSDETRRRLGIEVSRERTEFIRNIRHYNILESKELLSAIVDFYNNPPGDYDPSRWIVTKMNLNEDSSDLILTILEKYSNSEDIRLNETIGLGILHVIQSDYMKTATEPERNRFTSVVENLLARGPGEIHPFTLNWVNRSKRYMSELPLVKELYQNQKPIVGKEAVVAIESNKPSESKKSPQIEDPEKSGIVKNPNSTEEITTEEKKELSRSPWLLGILALLTVIGIVLQIRRNVG